jgi:hypothetical protein
MKPPIQMLDDYKRAKFREDLLSRTNNGVAGFSIGSKGCERGQPRLRPRWPLLGAEGGSR